MMCFSEYKSSNVITWKPRMSVIAYTSIIEEQLSL